VDWVEMWIKDTYDVKRAGEILAEIDKRWVLFNLSLS
jgi:hypothetical protein